MVGEVYVGRKFGTEFIGGDFRLGEEIAREFLGVCRILSSHGLAPGAVGNVSVRTAEGMLIKAGGRSLGYLTVDDIVLVVEYNPGTNTVGVRGRLEPSSETPMHWLIYSNFPRVNAVVHAHDPLVSGKPGLVERLGVETTAVEIPYGTRELAGEVIRGLKRSDYVFIRNHGSVSVGGNLRDAIDLMLKVHRRFEDES